MNQFVNFLPILLGIFLTLFSAGFMNNIFVFNNCTKSDLLTDHFIITFAVILPLLPYLSKKIIHYRKIKSINIPLFSSELVSILLSLPISHESLNFTLTFL